MDLYAVNHFGASFCKIILWDFGNVPDVDVDDSSSSNWQWITVIVILKQLSLAEQELFVQSLLSLIYLYKKFGKKEAEPLLD